LALIQGIPPSGISIPPHRATNNCARSWKPSPTRIVGPELRREDPWRASGPAAIATTRTRHRRALTFGEEYGPAPAVDGLEVGYGDLNAVRDVSIRVCARARGGGADRGQRRGQDTTLRGSPDSSRSVRGRIEVRGPSASNGLGRPRSWPRGIGHVCRRAASSSRPMTVAGEKPGLGARTCVARAARSRR